jgi:hypothetical protein
MMIWVAVLTIVAGWGEVPTVAAQSLPAECTIVGTARADRLLGTPGDDVICGLGGNDVLLGGAGDDRLIGGAGNDRLEGQEGSDTLSGDVGNDTLIGGIGDDSVAGGSGNDRLEGQEGSDTLSGDVGNDILGGGTGDDSVAGGSGNDRLEGQEGNDTLLGEGGKDTLTGAQGDDVLHGGDNRDTVNPGDGENRCDGDVSDIVTGLCTVDTTPPVIGPLALSRAAEAGSTVTFTWNVTDDVQVAQSWLFIGGPSGWIVWCGFPVMGALVAQNQGVDEYQATCDIPANAVNGEYLVEYNAVDLYGNYADPQRVVLTIRSGSDDAAPPTLDEFQMSTTQVVPGESANVTWTLYDESGISWGMVFLMYEGGGFADNTGRSWVESFAPQIVDTTETSTTLVQAITFRADAPTGTYRIWMSTGDALGNRDFFTTEYTITYLR